MKRFLEHANFVREHSPFYKEFYKNVPIDCEDISKYPIIDQEAFWKANENFGKGVLTEKYESGIVFKSGGTSGNPKYSYFSAKEWDDFTSISGKGFRKNGIQKGDRIANLFYAGKLYASFIYVTDLIKAADVGISYPIAGQTSIEDTVKMLEELNINVLAGVPTTIMNIISYLKEHQIHLDIKLILFGGESFYEDQLEVIKQHFKNVKVHSILYASVDGGELGYFDADTCENGEHRVFDESTIMEIVDEETGEVIEEENRSGRLLVTNLNRKLMPLIRYPAGDIATWCEKKGTPNRKYKLLGRSQEGARVGPATIYMKDIIDLLKYFHEEVQVLNFQILTLHSEQKDKAIIKILPQIMPKDAKTLAQKMITRLYDERQMLRDLQKNNIIHPVTIQWCEASDLETNPRTGKSKRIVDKRIQK